MSQSKSDDGVLAEFEALQKRVLLQCVRAAHEWAKYTQEPEAAPGMAVDLLHEALQSLERLYAMGEGKSPITTHTALVTAMGGPTEDWLFGFVEATEPLLVRVDDDGKVEITDYAAGLLDEAVATLANVAAEPESETDTQAA